MRSDPPPGMPKPPPHLLLVEDNPVALKMFESLASQAGCSYVGLSTAEEALSRIASEHFDLVITDIGLPGISGNRMARAIRALPGKASAVPVVAVTAHQRTETLAEAKASGMNVLMNKPLTLAGLKQLLVDFGL